MTSEENKSGYEDLNSVLDRALEVMEECELDAEIYHDFIEQKRIMRKLIQRWREERKSN